MGDVCASRWSQRAGVGQRARVRRSMVHTPRHWARYGNENRIETTTAERIPSLSISRHVFVCWTLKGSERIAGRFPSSETIRARFDVRCDTTDDVALFRGYTSRQSKHTRRTLRRSRDMSRGPPVLGLRLRLRGFDGFFTYLESSAAAGNGLGRDGHDAGAPELRLVGAHKRGLDSSHGHGNGSHCEVGWDVANGVRV